MSYKFKKGYEEWVMEQALEAMEEVQVTGDQQVIRNFFEKQDQLRRFIDQFWPKPFQMP